MSIDRKVPNYELNHMEMPVPLYLCSCKKDLFPHQVAISEAKNRSYNHG